MSNGLSMPPRVEPLEYSLRDSRRRRAMMLLAFAALIIGVVGAIAETIALSDGLCLGEDAAVYAQSSLIGMRWWIADALLAVLSCLALALAGFNFLRGSAFWWNAATTYVFLQLIAGMVAMISTAEGLVLDGIALTVNVTVVGISRHAVWAVFETFVLILLTRRPVRALLELAATAGRPANEPITPAS
jgi:hypothetical protein